ncbi:MAG: excinuclease ABC subunit UvrC [Candidatus Dormiibacterota bacterium]
MAGRVRGAIPTSVASAAAPGPGPADAVAGASLRLRQRPDLLKARLKAAPTTPGVYLFRAGSGQVIYVGKSANLRDRLRSYFVSWDSQPGRIQHLVDSVFDFEVIAAGSEQQALILENTLIKRHHPRYNVRLRDDKNYLYFRVPQPRARRGDVVPEEISEKLAAFPRPSFSRRLGGEGDRDFGPYTDAKSLRRSVREIRTVFPFRGCTDAIFRRGRVCLDYHLGICAGPCAGLIQPGPYADLLDDVAAFMEGRIEAVTGRLRAQMERASDELDFETAAALRDRLQTVEKLAKEQITPPRLAADVDVVGLAVDGTQGMAAVLLVRDGRLQGMERHPLEGVGEVEPAEVLSSFASQYYANSTHVPRTIYLPENPASPELLVEYLEARRHGRVELVVPRRGRFRTLLQRAQETATASLGQARIAQDFDSGRAAAALEDLRQRLGLASPPHRIECYDISNTMGEQSVGSMVVFEDARPKPADYRIFSIRSVEGPNDFASLEEVVTRRLGHLGRSDEGDQSLGVRPDLLIVDGGAGQLAAAHRALAALGLADLPHFGLAKRFEEIYAPARGAPIHLPEGSPALFLVQRVRDEAHRFAITRHRAKRSKAGVRSRLDEIGGLGPKRKRALLRRFGSVEGIRNASWEELTSVPGVTRGVAAAIKEIL